ncbi:salicylate 1-monooxygenase SalA [Colletotrichum plurivorum]|uniref:Salicylate 1-monooxygenase SalA n=1 Tax=Colletotrichum plurivorum TaxID=2175906 RepID=A0A8H6JKM3_9PEZI|nr:salicylate 1-monooxygenase SalA [Colletotrichum plurivorum]
MLEQKNFEVAIIGGGIAGITLAISLHRRGVPCTIYEKAHAFGEIGAGLGLTPNATRAMEACDPDVLRAFEKISQPPLRWDFLDGTTEGADDKIQFSLGDGTRGIRGCHRAHFLDKLLKLVPESITRFNKQLDRVEEPEGPRGRLRMVFRDGSTAEADAVVGADGIKSHTRGIIVGHDHPSAKPVYTHKYCYRGLLPMEQAVEIIGRERAFGSNLWAAQKVHMVTYPVALGSICNIVVHCQGDQDWPSDTQLTLPADKADLIRDASVFTPRLRKLIKLMKTVDQWGQFDLASHPVPTFTSGRICLIGDAAHASTPHQGAGAGMCIEDAATLAELLADDHVRCGADVVAAFAAYDAARRERGQWLVRTSRDAGELYEFRTEIGRDFEKMGQDVKARAEIVWDFDIRQSIEGARKDLKRRLAVEKSAMDYQQGGFRAGL